MWSGGILAQGIARWNTSIRPNSDRDALRAGRAGRGASTADGLDRLLDYRAPAGGARPGDLVEVPLGPRRVLGRGLGRGRGRLRRGASSATSPACSTRRRSAPAMRDVPRPRRRLHADAAPGDAAARHPRARASARRRPPRPLLRRSGRRARPDDRRRARACSPPSPSSATSASRRSSSRSSPASRRGVVKGLEAQGVLVREAAPRDAALSRARPRRRAAAAVAGAGRGRRGAARRRRAPARYATTLLKGVTGSGKTEVYLEAVAEALAPRPPGAGAAARDRALGRVPRPGRGPLRRPPRRVALRRHPGRPPPGLDGGGHRRRAARRRRALGAVPALRRPRARSSSTRSTTAPTSRRTARSTTPATWRCCAPRSRAPRSSSPRPRRRSRPGRTPTPASTPGSTCPSASASPSCRRCARSTCASTRPSRAAGSPSRSPRAVAERLAAGEQALLFLNRRGYAPLTICRACGHQVGCDALRRAHGRAPLPQAPGLPPVRRDQADPRPPARPARSRAG